MHTQAQGEVYARRIDAIPHAADTLRPLAPTNGRLIVAHSETGHHHTFAASAVEVLERTDAAPAGVAILYAIVKEPTTLDQHAASPHGSLTFTPGIYELRIAREYDPMLELARRVAD